MTGATINPAYNKLHFMNKNTSGLRVMLTATVLTLFVSCSKDFPRDGFFNPLIGGCQVAEYHISQFDGFFPAPPPYLFRNSFDPTGKIVTGIDCSFTNDILPETLPTFTLHLTVAQKANIVFLIIPPTGPDNNTSDTVGRIYLNRSGRPDSCVGGPGIDPFEPLTPTTEQYYYKNNRLLAVKDIATFPSFVWVSTYTITYDKLGNPLSFANNSYQYDDSRRAGQQFYCDDFMEFDREFYLLQYLGFFPEINNPPNLRTRVVNVDVPQGEAIESPTFDPEGKLISYGTLFGTSTITWNCR
jgi:hypothetical protein